MNTNKEFNDSLSEKDSVFFKSFDNVIEVEKISEEAIIERFKTVFDPEIPVNIYDLGLIYNINIDDNNSINIKMTLTTPNCPEAGSLPKKTGESLFNIKGVSSIKVELVWDPTWSKDMMSEDAKLALGIE